MTLKQLQALLKKLMAAAPEGTLTEAESTDLGAYDPQAAQDAAAAGARKEALKAQEKLEAERDALKEKLEASEAKLEEAGNKGQTEAQKTSKRLEKLETKLAEKDKQLAGMAEEAKQAKRTKAIGKLMAGVKFIDGVDPDMVTDAFHRQFSDLDDDDLADAEVTGKLVAAYKEKNAAIIQDTSGAGSGGPGNAGAGGGGGGQPNASKQSDAERAKYLAARK